MSPSRRTGRRRVALLLDEMHAPVVAAVLRERGHDVLAVSDDPDLRAMADEELFAHAPSRKRRIVTENIKDFRPLLLRAEESGQPTYGVLFTSSHTLLRSRRNPGLLIDALDAWLRSAESDERPKEDWLLRT